MKFKCFMSEERALRRVKRRAEWRDKFAFLPVRTIDGYCLWLETVQVRMVCEDWFGGWIEYRAKQVASPRRSGDE